MARRTSLLAATAAVFLIVGCNTLSEARTESVEPQRVGELRTYGNRIVGGNSNSTNDPEPDGRVSSLLNESETFGPPGEGLRQSKKSTRGAYMTYDRLVGSIGP
jgi:hypothetical protein